MEICNYRRNQKRWYYCKYISQALTLPQGPCEWSCWLPKHLVPKSRPALSITSPDKDVLHGESESLGTSEGTAGYASLLPAKMLEVLWNCPCVHLPRTLSAIMFRLCSFLFPVNSLFMWRKEKCKNNWNNEQAPAETWAQQKQQPDKSLMDAALHSALIQCILRRLAVKNPGKIHLVCEWTAALSIYRHFGSFPYISTEITTLDLYWREGEEKKKKNHRINSGKESQVPSLHYIQMRCSCLNVNIKQGRRMP